MMTSLLLSLLRHNEGTQPFIPCWDTHTNQVPNIKMSLTSSYRKLELSIKLVDLKLSGLWNVGSGGLNVFHISLKLNVPLFFYCWYLKYTKVRIIHWCMEYILAQMSTYTEQTKVKAYHLIKSIIYPHSEQFPGFTTCFMYPCPSDFSLLPLQQVYS